MSDCCGLTLLLLRLLLLLLLSVVENARSRQLCKELWFGYKAQIEGSWQAQAKWDAGQRRVAGTRQFSQLRGVFEDAARRGDSEEEGKKQLHELRFWMPSI